MARKKHQYNFPSAQDTPPKSRLGISLSSTGLDLLSQIAKKLNLSKSELVENLARGIINISNVNEKPEITLEITTNFQETTSLNKSQVIVTKIKDISPEKEPESLSNVNNLSEDQLLESKNETVENEVKLTENLTQEKDNLKEELHQKDQTFAHLQRQFEEKSLLVSYLQKQLQKSQKNHHEDEATIIELQQELKLKNKEFETLTKQLHHQQFTFDSSHKNYSQLQEQNSEQTKKNNLLTQEISQLKTNLQAKVNEVISLKTKINQDLKQLESLQTQLQESQHLLTETNYSYALCLEDNNAKIGQIINLQTKVNHQEVLLKTEGKNKLSLTEIIANQQLQLEKLQAELNCLRSLANFGENQLNKWRKRTFNS